MTQTEEARVRLEQRRSAIWAGYCAGKTQAQLAVEFDIDQTTVSRDIGIHRAAIPPQAKDQLRDQHLEQLARITRELMALVDAGPAPVTAGKDGRIVRHPTTNEPVWDHSGRMAAVDRLLRTQENIRKLVGLDAPTEISATVTAKPAELLAAIAAARAQQAAAEADLVGRVSVE